jgi:hypothetical protein
MNVIYKVFFFLLFNSYYLFCYANPIIHSFACDFRTGRIKFEKKLSQIFFFTRYFILFYFICYLFICYLFVCLFVCLLFIYLFIYLLFMCISAENPWNNRGGQWNVLYVLRRFCAALHCVGYVHCF